MTRAIKLSGNLINSTTKKKTNSVRADKVARLFKVLEEIYNYIRITKIMLHLFLITVRASSSITIKFFLFVFHIKIN
jgi:hypothetical protein